MPYILTPNTTKPYRRVSTRPYSWVECLGIINHGGMTTVHGVKTQSGVHNKRSGEIPLLMLTKRRGDCCGRTLGSLLIRRYHVRRPDVSGLWSSSTPPCRQRENLCLLKLTGSGRVGLPLVSHCRGIRLRMAHTEEY